MNSNNTFDEPNTLTPATLRGLEIENGKVIAKLPVKSIVILAIKWTLKQGRENLTIRYESAFQDFFYLLSKKAGRSELK